MAFFRNRWIVDSFDLKSSIIIGLCFCIGFVYTNKPATPYRDHIPDTRIGSERSHQFIQLVFIGSSTCRFSNNDKLIEYVRSLKSELRSFADTSRYDAFITGVSLDQNASIGLEFLWKTGPYDQVISGAGLYNLGAHVYALRNGGKLSTPQVYIIRSSYIYLPTYSGIEGFNEDHQLLAKASGVAAIERLHNRIESQGILTLVKK